MTDNEKRRSNNESKRGHGSCLHCPRVRCSRVRCSRLRCSRLRLLLRARSARSPATTTADPRAAATGPSGAGGAQRRGGGQQQCERSKHERNPSASEGEEKGERWGQRGQHCVATFAALLFTERTTKWFLAIARLVPGQGALSLGDECIGSSAR